MPDNARSIFSQNLSFLLDRLGKSQIDVARELDVATGTVSSWVNGLKYPRIDKMQQLADYLGVSLSILIEEEGIETYKREAEEERLLSAYRSADQAAREYALMILESSAAKADYGKKDHSPAASDVG